MSLTPHDFIRIKGEQHKISHEAYRAINDAFEQAVKCPLPDCLRPATPADVIAGAVIWKPDFDGDCKWCIIQEVLRPNDDFKAWVSYGCVYGLHEAYVET